MMTKPSGSAATKTKTSSKKTASRHRTEPISPLPICQLIVEAHEQPHVSLGSFTADHPPKGFSIHINPDPEPDTIVTQVTKLGTEWSYELVLHITNYGNQAIDAEVWPL